MWVCWHTCYITPSLQSGIKKKLKPQNKTHRTGNHQFSDRALNRSTTYYDIVPGVDFQVADCQPPSPPFASNSIQCQACPPAPCSCSALAVALHDTNMAMDSGNLKLKPQRNNPLLQAQFISPYKIWRDEISHALEMPVFFHYYNSLDSLKERRIQTSEARLMNLTWRHKVMAMQGSFPSYSGPGFLSSWLHSPSVSNIYKFSPYRSRDLNLNSSWTLWQIHTYVTS